MDSLIFYLSFFLLSFIKRRLSICLLRLFTIINI